jgi:predicted DNA-binding protein with PD1-like motif
MVDEKPKTSRIRNERELAQILEEFASQQKLASASSKAIGAVVQP